MPDDPAGRGGAKLRELVADNGTAAGCEQTLKAHPDLDILVNNLGIHESVEFFDCPDAEWRRLFEANFFSGLRLGRYYLQRMLKRNSGRIVFVSSESAVNPAPEMAHYVERFIRGLFPDLPYESAEKRFMKENRPTSLLGRLIRPEELAAAVVFLCSPLGSAVNGESMRVDEEMIRSAVEAPPISTAGGAGRSPAAAFTSRSAG